jgi:hypothetical protein
MNSDEILSLIETRYRECPNVENGRCETWWRHDDCTVLAEILFKITKNKKYDKHKFADIIRFDNTALDKLKADGVE